MIDYVSCCCCGLFVDFWKTCRRSSSKNQFFLKTSKKVSNVVFLPCILSLPCFYWFLLRGKNGTMHKHHQIQSFKATSLEGDIFLSQKRGNWEVLLFSIYFDDNNKIHVFLSSFQKNRDHRASHKTTQIIFLLLRRQKNDGCFFEKIHYTIASSSSTSA